MNREEFLRQLEMLLADISEEEWLDAMAFYRSYFEDAGEGNEASILAELESPQKVAESIKKNLESDESPVNGTEGRESEAGNSGNPGYEYGAGNSGNPVYEYGVGNSGNPGYVQINEPQKHNTVNVALAVIVAVLTSPVWLTLLFVLVAILAALAAMLFGIAVSVIAVMASLVFVGILLFGIGIVTLFRGGPAVGLGLMGGGLLVLALGILAMILVVWMFGTFLPWAFRWIKGLCKKLFGRRKERAAV